MVGEIGFARINDKGPLIKDTSKGEFISVYDANKMYGTGEDHGTTEDLQYVKIDAVHKHDNVAHSHKIKYTGEAGTNKNMPPYLCVYMWKRVADNATITSNNIGLRPGLQNSGNLGNITITPPISGSGINSDKI